MGLIGKVEFKYFGIMPHNMMPCVSTIYSQHKQLPYFFRLQIIILVPASTHSTNSTNRPWYTCSSLSLNSIVIM